MLQLRTTPRECGLLWRAAASPHRRVRFWHAAGGAGSGPHSARWGGRSGREGRRGEGHEEEDARWAGRRIGERCAHWQQLGHVLVRHHACSLLLTLTSQELLLPEQASRPPSSAHLPAGLTGTSQGRGKRAMLVCVWVHSSLRPTRRWRHGVAGGHCLARWSTQRRPHSTRPTSLRGPTRTRYRWRPPSWLAL
ncbi:unnamed protein product [Prorocentrum cordatum]|uniref:Uncharacterized protein n=1 Tax=Prorocentrum cordatum TaxID=2364126 RepID=A0ABN9T1X0_9DINO|nr:unnamed protein product [Polarella glacialis]